MSDTMTADLIQLLHQIDGQLGLAVYRDEGRTDLWKHEADALIGRIRRTIRMLEETQVTGYWDDPEWIEQTVRSTMKAGIPEASARETVEHLRDQIRFDHARRARQKRLGL